MNEVSTASLYTLFKRNPFHMKYLILFIFPFILPSCSTEQKATQDPTQEILALMDEQAAAWSRGDLEAFMEPYWHSDSLMFIGGKGVNYGYNTVLDNYKKTYSTPSGMGQLVFDITSVEPLSSDHVWLVGKWQLNRESDTLKGMYTLLWKHIDGEWKIVADHSS